MRGVSFHKLSYRHSNRGSGNSVCRATERGLLLDRVAIPEVGTADDDEEENDSLEECQLWQIEDESMIVTTKGGVCVILIRRFGAAMDHDYDTHTRSTTMN